MSKEEHEPGVYDWGWDFSEMLSMVPGVRELEGEGFTPIETLFGETELGAAWPVEHRREVRDTRFEQTGQDPPTENDLRLFLVRSPWSDIDLGVVVKLMFRWLRRNRHRYLSGENEHMRHVDPDARLAIVEEFFRQPAAWVRAYGRGRINRLV